MCSVSLNRSAGQSVSQSVSQSVTFRFFYLNMTRIRDEEEGKKIKERKKEIKKEGRFTRRGRD